MGKKMAGTNEFAFVRCRSICTGGGGSRIRLKKMRKNAFRPVPVQKFTFPAELIPKKTLLTTRFSRNSLVGNPYPQNYGGEPPYGLSGHVGIV